MFSVKGCTADGTVVESAVLGELWNMDDAVKKSVAVASVSDDECERVRFAVAGTWSTNDFGILVNSDSVSLMMK